MKSRRPSSSQIVGTLSRRELVAGLGATTAAGLLPGCGLGPEVCGTPPLERAATTERDRHARALLSHIDTFVVVMLENRSFDHFLGGLRLDRRYPAAARIEGLTGQEGNLDSSGRFVPITRMPGDGRGSFNPQHDWRSVTRTFNGGLNDRFLTVNADHPEVLSYLGRDQVPLFHALADRYTVFDRWFASYMGQTWPNRFYLHATTSGGRRENRPFDLDAPLGIWERLAERCYSARNYAAGPVLWYSVAFPARLWTAATGMVPGKIEDFFRDARSGNLPNFSLIDPDFKVNDAYPTHSPALCEAFIASIVKALAESPQWSRSLLLITFDEHGGYFDHLAPPAVVDLRPAFRQLGFRVPTLAVGPSVRRAGVVSTVLDHVAVAATLRARFGIETLSARMDATSDFADCIDPALIASPSPPPRDLEPVELSRAALARVRASGRPSSQPEMDAALADHHLPDELVDARSDEERFGSWLRQAQELGAVKVRG